MSQGAPGTPPSSVPCSSGSTQTPTESPETTTNSCPLPKPSTKSADASNTSASPSQPLEPAEAYERRPLTHAETLIVCENAVSGIASQLTLGRTDKPARFLRASAKHAVSALRLFRALATETSDAG